MAVRLKEWGLYGALLSGLTHLSYLRHSCLVSILLGISRTDITVPPLLGNRPEVISRLTDGPADARPFSFLVVGDTKSSNTFEHFYEDAALEATPDFGVMLGDFVADPELNRHRFFMEEFAEWGMTFPFFLIAGNHDIVTRHTRKCDRLTDPFLEQDFERVYGPTNFSFIYRGCLFIGLDDLYGTGYIDYARDVLSRRPQDVLMTFVFMHIPPKSLSPMIRVRIIEGEQDFMDLMEIYKVDYVIMGDFHSYFRGDDKHTKYIITGGGGSPLYEGTTRSFHHLILMVVDTQNKQVDEIIYPINSVFDLGDDLEIVMTCKLYPFFEERPILWATVFSVGTVIFGGLFVFVAARIVRKRRGAGSPGA